MAEYKPQTVEEKWQGVWQREKTFRADDNDPRPKYYVLEMLPYPSGDLHVGHAKNYTLGDAVARMMRMRGLSMWSTRWAGTPSGCRLKMLRSTTRHRTR